MHLNNTKEGPIAQNIQDTLLKQFKKQLKTVIYKMPWPFRQIIHRLAFWPSYPQEKKKNQENKKNFISPSHTKNISNYSKIKYYLS